MNRTRTHLRSLLALSVGLLAAVSAQAASLQKVNQSDWAAGVTGVPSYVTMYIYVPDAPAAKPPIVVAPHHCQGTGTGTYSEMSSLVSIANKNGFIIIFPEATGENCWDAGSTRALKHNGGGDTGAIVQMVKYTLSKYGGDAARVYSVGGSSGGIMTEALLGVYPDVFMAGVSLMGVPCGCWAQGYSDVTGTGSTAQWSGSCAGGSVTKTGQQWGDLVRSYFPGYTGHRPRLQHWHGTADTTLNYKNMAEDIKEWTNLLGLSETPTATDMPKSGTTHQLWKGACGFTVYETFSLSGVAHAVPFDGNAVAAYFGLDKAGGEDPETAACSGGPGTGGAGGATGRGGAGGTTTGAGGATSGRGGQAGGDAGKGGAFGQAGASGRGGAGPVGTGGSSSNGGVSGATGGTGADITGQGGSIGEGGGPVGVAGRSGEGGIGGGAETGHGGTSATGGTPGEDASSGCGCALGGHAPGAATNTALLIAALMFLRARSKRRAHR
jgi:acetylxylan esterase